MQGESKTPSDAGERALVHVIDADRETRETLERLLGAHDIAVQGFDCAEAFLRAFRPGGRQCIVTEAHLPGMGGLELQERLRARGATVPVLVLARHGDVQLAVRAMQNGAVDVFEKPYVDDVLVARIRGTLRALPA